MCVRHGQHADELDILPLTDSGKSSSSSYTLCHVMDCRQTGEHVREVVDVVRKSDNGLGSVGEKVEEVQDSLEHAQVGVCIRSIMYQSTINLPAALVRDVHRCYSAFVRGVSHVFQTDSTPQPGSMPCT